MEYSLLPFRFTPIPGDSRYLATNFSGQHRVLARADIEALVSRTIPQDTTLFADLQSEHFVLPAGSTAALHLLAAKYRTRRLRVPDLAVLHIFVVTLRCNHRCTYCQASRTDADDATTDMPLDVADGAVEFMFQSPAPLLKVEFQGGEPLLAFDVVRRIVEKTEERAKAANRSIEFVLCSNLLALGADHLDYMREHNFFVSTSLDGPQALHDQNRIATGGSGYDTVVRKIAFAQEKLGADRVGALMTATRWSLDHPEAIVDEYVARGLHSIFLRPVNPYGFAARQWETLGYTADDWLVFYRRALAHIIKLNRAGTPICEQFASLMLRRMLRPYGDGYVDLQSPTGCGLHVLVYNYDGGIYLSDEGRMLAAMGDRTFRFGDVRETNLAEFLSNRRFLRLVDCTMTEGMPECVDCAYQPYCGSDPVRQYRVDGDVVGRKAGSSFCRKIRSVVGHLAVLLEDDPGARDVLWSWA